MSLDAEVNCNENIPEDIQPSTRCISVRRYVFGLPFDILEEKFPNNFIGPNGWNSGRWAKTNEHRVCVTITTTGIHWFSPFVWKKATTLLTSPCWTTVTLTLLDSTDSILSVWFSFRHWLIHFCYHLFDSVHQSGLNAASFCPSNGSSLQSDSFEE